MVDDDEEARLLAAGILEAEGYEVSLAKDGYEAVERLKAESGFQHGDLGSDNARYGRPQSARPHSGVQGHGGHPGAYQHRPSVGMK